LKVNISFLQTNRDKFFIFESFMKAFMKDLRYKILFLASWYPSRINKVLGMFVKRKAEAMTARCNVSVLYATMDESLKDRSYEIVTSVENNVYTIIVYFAPFGSGVIKKIFFNLRFLKSWYIGFRTVRKNWGEVDLIHVNVVDRAGYIALLLKYLKKIKYVITEHSTPDIKFLLGETTSTKIPLLPLKKIVIKNAEYINVDSSASLRYWKKAGLEGNYGIIENVVEINPKYLNHQKKNDGIKRAVHISMLMERKNAADIIRAYADIYFNKRRKNIELHIIGIGEQKELLEKLADELNVLNKCVFFHGFVEEEKKLELLVNSDFHILNSDEEGFSVVTAEAILYGIPVIATKCGGPEDFVPEEVGVLINRRNLPELINAILFMLDNSEKYDKKILQNFGKKKFVPEIVAEKTYHVYKNAITNWKAGNTKSIISINPGWKVLDVGSGHQPNRRANVIVERYLGETIHRTTQKVLIPIDKNMIIGDAHKLPFKDKNFDFVIASHIAEHVDDPVKFCEELQRVAVNGYLETPGPLTEFLLPAKSHKWVVKKSGEEIIFKTNPYKKPFSKFFFSLFYLNRDEYGEEILNSNNFILKTVNFMLVKIWKYLPQAYTIKRWNKPFKSKLIN
jgi:glycosyltransferase involved in cell wall biosynthesis